ncbi:WD-40 repeat-containing protein [Methanoculleus bourgensis MS2]|uniref:WD-40 repeat-containing protein n=2 Tax=Methanoculleus bourgensis TaxID=83986 RepID=I7KBL9_METBM|nr:WD-40 repeat-containing protein [Methanoculleus bourgensis MS2]
MTQKGGYQGPILKNNHVIRLKSSGGHGVWRVLTCLIMLCLIAGTSQAYSSDNPTGTASQGVQIRTELYLYPEAGNSVSQGDSGGGGGLSAVLLWTHSFTDAVTAISMPTDGSAVAVGTAGGEIALLNSSGNVLWTYQSGAPVTGLGITAGGSAIAAGTGNWIMMLDADGQILWTMDTGSRVLGAGISPEGKYCAARTAAGDILLTNSRGGLLWKTQPGSAVTAVAVGPDGAFVAAGTEDGSIYLLNSRGDVLWTRDAGSAVQSVSIAAGGSAVAAGTAGSTVLLLDNEGRGGAVWTGDDPIYAVHLDPRGSRIGAGTGGGYAHLLNGAGVRLWEFGRVWSPEGENSAVTAVAFSSPPDYLAIGSDNRNAYYFIFASRTPPTVILEQGTVTPEATSSATLLGDMQAAPEMDSTPGEGGDPAPQEAPGYSLAVALGAVAIIAVFRRIGR